MYSLKSVLEGNAGQIAFFLRRKITTKFQRNLEKYPKISLKYVELF